MSHRTKDLPPLSGLNHSLRELRYHEISRQLLAVALILLYALTAMPSPLLVAVGMPLALAGTLIRLYASGFIVKNEELATNGPYALVRHPLYTGNILIVGGFSAANASWWALPLAVIFFWFYYPCAIEYEDRKLKRYFGERWEHWAGDVPALVPAFRNAAAMRGGRWSFAKSLRRNGEIVIAVYIVACMGLIVW
ncbi:methyltransferase family protein [Candidatus Rariloculus sp.]|uniref:methyltransferase family protein n=1 Tax=Candidatus Rariloculus sp. TaxID=3101265 RepID=UPI003D0F3DD4